MSTFESTKSHFQVDWLISNLRWLLLVSVSIVSFLDIFIHHSNSLDIVSFLPQAALLIIAAFYNLGVMFLLSYGATPHVMPTMTLLVDTILAIGFVTTSGGLTSPLLFFALFPILTAALRFPWVVSLLIALAIIASSGFIGYLVAPPDIAWSNLVSFVAPSPVLLLAALTSALVGNQVRQAIRHLSLSGDVASYRRDLEDARASDDRLLEGVVLSQIGAAYAEAGKIPRAIEHYEQALAIARELGDSQAEAVRLQNLGLALLRLSNAEPDQSKAHLSRAADALRRAIDLFDAREAVPLLRARTRYHLGRCYHQLGRWREAITLLEQAREIFSRHKSRLELAHALLELGQLYYLIHDFESAYIYLKDAMRLFRRMEDSYGIAVAQEALGSLALQTAHLSEAIVSFQKARRRYVTLRREERVRAVDDLLRIAQQAR